MAKKTIAELEEMIVELAGRVEELEKATHGRDRGPKSEKAMTEEDARRIILGDLKEKSHKECAEILKLSYGQIYSARGGYTFKKVTDELIAQSKKS